MAAKKLSSTDLTQGPILKILLIFTIPILLSNLLQQLYNVIDIAVIGNVLGDDALAAVGAAGPIYELIIGIASGFGSGFSIIIARFFGAQKEAKLKEAIAWSYAFSLIIALILTFIGLVGLRPLLLALNTPLVIIEDTLIYMQIIISFSIITIFYNLFAGMLRAIGNSRVPLYFLAVSIIFNIFLDILFVKYLCFAVAGAAAATMIAQLISAFLCITYIYTKCPLLRFDIQFLKKDMNLILDLLTTGLSMSLMYVVVSVGTIALQSSVNSFGEQTIAAHSAARKIDSALIMPIGSLNTSSATFTSQNYGAQNIRRVKKGISFSLIICFIWGLIATVIAYTCGEQFVKMLTGSENTALIATSLQYIKINIPFLHALSILIILRSSLQGVGHKMVPLLGSFIESVFKFIAAAIVAPTLGYFGICILEPTIWSVCAVIVTIDYFLFIKKYKEK